MAKVNALNEYTLVLDLEEAAMIKALLGTVNYGNQRALDAFRALEDAGVPDKYLAANSLDHSEARIVILDKRF